jgi:MGT family glycosyltransferase
MSTRPRRFLFAVWDGGGNAPPQIAVGGRLVKRGHQVHILGDPSLAAAAEAAGCTFSRWRRGTAQTGIDASDTESFDWATEEPLDVVRRIRDHLQSGPASEYAADTAAAIEEFEPDVVAPDSQIFGAIIAAQEAGLPVVALVPNLWMVPSPGTGDPLSLKLVNRVMKAGLPDLNEARAERGLPPLDDFYDQLLGVDRILMLTSETFDDAAPFLPSNVHYVGPVLDDPVWAEPWSLPWPDSNQDPLVLVTFSNLFQNQGPLLQRVIDALATMKVRAVVTLGRTLADDALVGTDNVAVARFVPHSQLLQKASLVISHCGHGTTIKALSAGVPIVCVPMGRDQDATAACVVKQGAGVVLPPGDGTVERIGQDIRTVLDNDEYRANARRLASTFAEEHQPIDVVLELEGALRPAPADAD